MITPGTTPNHQYTFPSDIDPATCQSIAAIYCQDDRIVLEKTSFNISGQTASVRLTKEETMLFEPGLPCDIELWIKDSAGVIPKPFRTSLAVDTVKGSGVV